MAMAHTTADILREKGNRVAWNMHAIKPSHAQLSRRPALDTGDMDAVCLLRLQTDKRAIISDEYR